MTCLADFPSKKAFRAAVEEFQTLRREAEKLSKEHHYVGTKLTDPSIVAPYYGPIDKHPSLVEAGSFITVTNPKRQWFAQVKRGTDGLLHVS